MMAGTDSVRGQTLSRRVNAEERTQALSEPRERQSRQKATPVAAKRQCGRVRPRRQILKRPGTPKLSSRRLALRCHGSNLRRAGRHQRPRRLGHQTAQLAHVHGLLHASRYQGVAGCEPLDPLVR